MYKLQLKNSVVVWSEKTNEYTRKETTTDFKFNTAGTLADLVREMTISADDPLEFRISREDDNNDR